MKIGAKYSHLNGLEWLKVRRPGLWEEIETIIGSIDAEAARTKKSEEKKMLGRSLYAPTELNRAFEVGFTEAGWAEARTQYWVTDDRDLITRTLDLQPKDQRDEIDRAGKTPIRSSNQTDFVKNRVAVEVQFGHYTSIPYDLFVKHMAFYIGDKIDLGIEIMPMKSMLADMSSGPGYYERGLYDMVRQGRGVPSVPLILIGILPDA